MFNLSWSFFQPIVPMIWGIMTITARIDVGIGRWSNQGPDRRHTARGGALRYPC